LCSMRCPPGPCVPGWSPADRGTFLHEFGVARFQKGRFQERIKSGRRCADQCLEVFPVDFVQVFLSQAVALFGYALLVTAVYKIFQLSKEVQEIKDLLKKSGRSSSFAPAVQPPVAYDGPADESGADEYGADEYAANLLRSLQAESPRSESEPRKTA